MRLAQRGHPALCSAITPSQLWAAPPRAPPGWPGVRRPCVHPSSHLLDPVGSANRSKRGAGGWAAAARPPSQPQYRASPSCLSRTQARKRSGPSGVPRREKPCDRRLCPAAFPLARKTERFQSGKPPVAAGRGPLRGAARTHWNSSGHHPVLF